MHRKYAALGFAAVSVSLDDPGNARDRAQALEFLRRQQARFTNVILDAEPEQWQTYLRIAGPPCVYVFNRDNQFVLKQTEEVDYTVIARRVQELLGQKETRAQE
jgi:hypothetical protein